MSQHSLQNPTGIASSEGWDDHSFLIGPCSECAAVVLTARDLVGDELVDLCMHCDGPIDRQQLQWAGSRQVMELGYFIDGVDGGEVSDGHGGCRDGACGVRQPD